MILPLGFARVDENVYRSGYPAKKSLDFIGTLGLKSMVSLLNPSENRSDLKAHCKAHDIFLFEADIGVNKEPFLSMNAEVVTAVLKHLDNKSNLPCLLFCSNGKLRTSCMIGW
jgi:tyrosine-protein phosphatase SIW14